MVVPPNQSKSSILIVNSIFPYKPTILGYLHLWTPSCAILIHFEFGRPTCTLLPDRWRNHRRSIRCSAVGAEGSVDGHHLGNPEENGGMTHAPCFDMFWPWRKYCYIYKYKVCLYVYVYICIIICIEFMSVLVYACLYVWIGALHFLT